MYKEKVMVVINWPIPKSVKSIRGFLRLAGYYRKFIRNFATITASLTDLLKKDAYEWDEMACIAFNNLKIALTQVLVLALPDFKIPFVVECDASGVGLGAVLMQGNCLSTYEQEMLALVVAAKNGNTTS